MPSLPNSDTVIILSLVRSNSHREVGFLSDRRRINVAVTRARRQLMVVGDAETCSADPFLQGLLDYMSEHGDHRSAAEFTEPANHPGSMILELPVVKTEPPPAIKLKVDTPSLNNKSELSKAPTKRSIQASSSMLTISRSEYEAKLNESMISLVLRFAEKTLSGGVISILPYDATVNRKSELVIVTKDETALDALVFPSSLNSFQRMKLHAVAEEKSLAHQTMESSEGKLLHISLKNVSHTARIEYNDVAANSTEKNSEEEILIQETPRQARNLSAASNGRNRKGVAVHGSVYVSPYRLTQQQKPLDFSIEDEDVLLDSAINANKVFLTFSILSNYLTT